MFIGHTNRGPYKRARLYICPMGIVGIVKTLVPNFQLIRSGGFRRIYAGLGPAAIGSAPSAALFFCTYETSKHMFATALPAPPAAHMAAASIGEVAACLVRVPIEIVKQVCKSASSTFHVCVCI